MSEPRVLLADGEFAELIHRAGHNNHVACTFGPGWVALDPEGPSYRWALEQLADLRGIDLTPTPTTTTTTDEL